MFSCRRLLFAAVVVGFPQAVLADKPVSAGGAGVIVCDGVDTAAARTLRIDPEDLEMFLAEGAIEGECPPGAAGSLRSTDRIHADAAIVDRPIEEAVYHVY